MQARTQIKCNVCGDIHPKTLINRSAAKGRYCKDCQTYHPAAEVSLLRLLIWCEPHVLLSRWFVFSQGQVWGETEMRLRKHFYACIGGEIFELTEWAACQVKTKIDRRRKWGERRKKNADKMAENTEQEEKKGCKKKKEQKEEDDDKRVG